MNNHDDEIHHDDVYGLDLDNDHVDDLEEIIALEDEAVDEIEEIEEIEEVDSGDTRIELLVNVNGFKKGDVLIVDQADAFFGGLLAQGLAKETVDGV